MRFSLEVIRARKGDCLLLHHGTADDPRLMLIDGGPSGVYGPFLKPRLQAIRAARGLDDDQPLDIDRILVSHVDDDHIRGLLDLTRELRDQPNPKRGLVKIAALWHNAFEDVIGRSPDKLTSALGSRFGPASTGGQLPDDATLDHVDDDIDERTVAASLMVLASIEQGDRLRADAEALGAALNPEFPDGLISADDTQPIALEDGPTFTVVGPLAPDLEALRKKHDAWERKRAENHPTAEEALSAYIDKSVTNLSSIVMLAKAGDKSILLTGDARGDKILEGLERAGLMKPGGSIRVDVLKVPHHGSANNLDLNFFKRIKADHYVFSGDGEHGNPEREAFEMLIKARGRSKYVVHLTHPIADIDQERAKDWAKERNKQLKRREKNPRQEVRPEWSAEQNGLESLLAANPSFAKKIQVVDPERPHLIDLLERVDG